MSDSWRMAFMLKGKDTSGAGLRRALDNLAHLFANAAPNGSAIRVGVTGQCVDAATDDVRMSPKIDAAIEITVAAASIIALPDIAASWSELLDTLVDRPSCIAVAGPVYSIVSPRPGSVFYSLAFRRAPNTTLEDFQSWWRNQHAPLATRLLGSDLLGYDQVHLSHDVSRSVSDRAGFSGEIFDAYDNLSWKDADAYACVLSNQEALSLTYQDEIGHVNHATYTGSLLNVTFQA